MGSKSKTDLKDKLDGNELDLSLSNLAKVPVKDIASLTKATTLDLSCNQLTSLPESFCSLTRFVKLDLSKNALTSLPEGFGQLTNLRHLDLLGNKLERLPISFAELESLKWLDLKENPLVEPPPKLVGDCLDDKQCKICAQRVLQYMRDLKEIHDQKKEELLAKQKAEEEAEEARRISREQKEKAKMKKQKQREKDRRRAEFLAVKAAREQEEAAKGGGDQKSEESENEEEEPVKVNGTTHTFHKDKDGSYTWAFLIVLLITAVLGITVGAYLHCQEHGEIQWCTQVNDFIRPFKEQIRTWLK